MKRARLEDDFNPVYPYEHYNPLDIPFITPPFASSNGLQEKPPGVLSLKYTDPLTTKNGALTLKLGTGLNIDENGDLIQPLEEYDKQPIEKDANDFARKHSLKVGIRFIKVKGVDYISMKRSKLKV